MPPNLTAPGRAHARPSTGTAIDDGLAVVDYVKALLYVDASRIHLYGVSLV
jgi:dipeptidyl aminopeptidase/acylaminoacyl peptidase